MYVHECFVYKSESLEIAIEPCNEVWSLRFILNKDTVISATLNDEQLRSLKLALDAHFAFKPDGCVCCGNEIGDSATPCPVCANVQPDPFREAV